MKRVLLFALVIPLVFAASTRAGDPPRIRGTLHGDIQWSGEVLLGGDVTIAADALLRIAPGTQVRIAKNASPRGGLDDGLVEIQVYGGILAEGTDRHPITFAPEGMDRLQGPRPSRGWPVDWHGLIVYPAGRERSRLRWCVFQRAFTGVQAGGEGLLLEDCVFHACRMGVGTGRLWATRDESVAVWDANAPRLLRCRFGDCVAGVTVEGTARPHLERCVIHNCRFGVGNRRAGVTWSVSGLGPFLDRCDILFCRVGVHGPSRIVNSMLLFNGAALSPSAFQRRYGVSTDRVVRSHNLYYGNRFLVRGDTDLGAHPVFENPMLAASPSVASPLDHLMGDLARRYGLLPRSPALGKATDGGDLGAVGASGNRLPWQTLPDLVDAFVFRDWLVLGPAAEVGEGPRPRALERMGRKSPTPGELVEGAAWARFVTEGRPPLRPPFLRPGGGTLWAISTCVGADPGVRELRIGADAKVRAWWNGRALRLPDRRRRFDADDMRVPVEVEEGRNVLVVHLEPWTSAPRFLARLVAPTGDEGRLVRVIEDPSPRRPPRPKDVLKKAVAHVPKKTGLVEGRVFLHARIHWDVLRRGGDVVFLSSAGTERRPSSLRVLPKRRMIEFEGVRLVKGATYEVRTTGLVDPAGEPLPDATVELIWR